MHAPIAVSTFYHFAPLEAREPLKLRLLNAMHELGIRGTITLAPEGINATISGSDGAIASMLGVLRSIPGFAALSDRISYFTAQPFGKSKVKLKPELISLGAEANPAVCVGEHIAPAQWNALISRDDVVTIDTRNDYEYRIGHFKGALNPATKNFKEMVAFTAAHLNPETHPHVAMYCTGGIRCEKYSAYLLHQGFTNVYHLRGGILAYLETISHAESLWEGDCYVFDERVAVGHGLSTNADASMCLGCGQPLYSADRAHAHYAQGAHCPYCYGSKAAMTNEELRV